MSFFDFFLGEKKKTAYVAKERLQIIVAHQRNQSSQPQFLETMKQEILEVVKKYFAIDLDDIKADISHEGETEMLELNINLHNKEIPQAAPASSGDENTA